MTKFKRISSRDVAKEAGVSQATVSYVLNNAEGVKIKPETREAVLQAAKRLNYHTNQMARGMRLNKSMSIGVVSEKNMSSFIFTSILEGIRTFLGKKNYSITLCAKDTGSCNIDESDYIKYYKSGLIDGIIFAYANLTAEEQVYLSEQEIPFVAINAHVTGFPHYHVKTNIWDAIHEMAGYFLKNGIKRISYIGAASTWITYESRYSRYLRELEKYNIEFDENIILNLSVGDSMYDSALKEYFESLRTMPEAIFTDTVALGFSVLRYAAKCGIKIPDELSVVSMGSSQFIDRSYPALSTIEAPLFDMGIKGCELLFDRLNDYIIDDAISLSWRFVIRESC